MTLLIGGYSHSRRCTTHISIQKYCILNTLLQKLVQLRNLLHQADVHSLTPNSFAMAPADNSAEPARYGSQSEFGLAV